MRKNTTVTIWAVTPEDKTIHGEIISSYSSPREIRNVNLQTDYSELDVAAYGERLNEMLRARTNSIPYLKEGDHVFLSKPDKPVGMENPGDYEVVSVKPGYGNAKLYRNPTIIDMKRITI